MLSSDVLVRTTTPATTTSPACSSSFVSLSSVSDAVLITHVKEYNADLLNRLVQFTQNETTLLEDQWILAPLRDSIRVTCFDEEASNIWRERALRRAASHLVTKWLLSNSTNRRIRDAMRDRVLKHPLPSRARLRGDDDDKASMITCAPLNLILRIIYDHGNVFNPHCQHILSTAVAKFESDGRHGFLAPTCVSTSSFIDKGSKRPRALPTNDEDEDGDAQLRKIQKLHSDSHLGRFMSAYHNMTSIAFGDVVASPASSTASCPASSSSFSSSPPDPQPPLSQMTSCSSYSSSLPLHPSCIHSSEHNDHSLSILPSPTLPPPPAETATLVDETTIMELQKQVERLKRETADLRSRLASVHDILQSEETKQLLLPSQLPERATAAALFTLSPRARALLTSCYFVSSSSTDAVCRDMLVQVTGDGSGKRIKRALILEELQRYKLDKWDGISSSFGYVSEAMIRRRVVAGPSTLPGVDRGAFAACDYKSAGIPLGFYPGYYCADLEASALHTTTLRGSLPFETFAMSMGSEFLCSGVVPPLCAPQSTSPITSSSPTTRGRRQRGKSAKRKDEKKDDGDDNQRDDGDGDETWKQRHGNALCLINDGVYVPGCEDKYDMPNHKRESTADRTNVRCVDMLLCGKFRMTMIATTRPIRKGQELFFPYGGSYWRCISETRTRNGLVDTLDAYLDRARRLASLP